MIITLDQAAQLLNSNQVIAIPTETVYGLAARMDSASAVAEIFRLKGRPADNPLIVHIASVDQAHTLANIDEKTFLAMTKLWPGPVTFVVPAKKEIVSSIVRANLPTVALRVPAAKLTRELIAKTGALVAPSANLSGKPSPTQADHVEADFGIDFPVLDGGACERGVESTILSRRDDKWYCLRLGAFSLDELSKKLGEEILLANKNSNNTPTAPGQKYRHYAPQAKLWLATSENELKNLITEKNCDAVIGFDDTFHSVRVAEIQQFYSLGARSNPETALHNLYATLRQLDIDLCENVAVDLNVPSDGLWQTLRERLGKASMK